MSSYTDIMVYLGTGEKRGRLEKDIFPGVINSIQIPKNNWDGTGEMPYCIAHKGLFFPLMDITDIYHGSFNYLDWNEFREEVKKYKWTNPLFSKIMVKFEYDPLLIWYHFTVDDIRNDKDKKVLDFIYS